MAALPNLITVEEFRQLQDSGEYVCELHYGEVVAMTRPREGHSKLQHRLMDLLRAKLSGFGEVRVEYPYRPVPQFDLRSADVAVISRSRYRQIDDEDNLRGAPELMIEVISPSNTNTKLRETVTLCLNNGAVECWLVDRHKPNVTVVRRDGLTSVYGPGSEIPLTAFGGDCLRVDDIFA